MKRLTESQLRSIIRESVREIMETAGHLYSKDDDGNVYTNSNATWHGVDGTIFISHGDWADPTVIYDGQELNGADLEDNAWEAYRIECEENGKQPTEREFDNLPSEWFKEYLDYGYIYN